MRGPQGPARHHGTEAAARIHHWKGEPQCDACRAYIRTTTRRTGTVTNLRPARPFDHEHDDDLATITATITLTPIEVNLLSAYIEHHITPDTTPAAIRDLGTKIVHQLKERHV